MDDWALSPGTSLLLLWLLHSEHDGLSLVTAAAWIACMDNLALYELQLIYLHACVPRLPVSLLACLLHLVSVHYSAFTQPLQSFFLPLPLAQVFPSSQDKLVYLLPFPRVTPGAHVAFPLLAPLVSIAQWQCIHPVVLGLLFVIVIISQILCQNPIAKRLLGPLHTGRHQFFVIGLHAEGMFDADAYYCLLLIADLFLLIVCSSLLWVLLACSHASISKIMGNGREDSQFLSL